MERRALAVALVAAVAVSQSGCTATKNKGSGGGIRLSGPGPEIAGGALVTAAGVGVMYRVGAGEDQFNAQQTLFVLGLGLAAVGVGIMAHGIYRLATR